MYSIGMVLHLLGSRPESIERFFDVGEGRGSLGRAHPELAGWLDPRRRHEPSPEEQQQHAIRASFGYA